MNDTEPGDDEQRGNALEVFKAFLALGLTSFGGPVAHIGYFRRELVARRGWVSEIQFGQLLTLCQFLPGPASSQLGFALGLLRAGWLGAVAAFIAFTLPSVLLLFGFAWYLPDFSHATGVAVIHGLKLAACVVVADAVLGMARNLCPDNLRRGIAILAAAILLWTGSAGMQLLVVIFGAIAGLLLCQTSIPDQALRIPSKLSRRLGLVLLVLFIGLLVWFVLFPQTAGLAAIADAFYRAGALVFGGGHVVLPLLEASLVAPGWVERESFLAGYGAAQAVPGPMFSFSAFLGAIIGGEDAAWRGAVVAVLFMFLPGFLLLAAALPFWQVIAQSRYAGRAIAGVNAAIVGVLGAALYDPVFTSGVESLVDMAIVVGGFALLRLWRASPLWVVLWCVSLALLLDQFSALHY